MRIEPLIEYLRLKLTSWNQRIYGATNHEIALDESRLVLPSMFVSYIGTTATTLSNTDLLEDIDERFRIIIILNNTLDRTGKNAQDQVHLIREALLSVLLNYQYEPERHTLQFVKDEMLATDKARYVHAFEFRQLGRIGPEDGVLIDAVDNFNRFYTDWNLVDSSEAVHPDAQDHMENLYTA